MRGKQPVTDLLNAPNGQRVSQLLFGESFAVEQTDGAYSFGHMACGYQGWVASDTLAQSHAPSHSVCTRASFVYAHPDMKSDMRLRLPFGAKITVLQTEGDFARLPEGFIFSQHITNAPAEDFVATAERFLGTPYLWGGRSSLGIDCSGLAQIALQSAGLLAPRDSGPQALHIGSLLPPNTPLRRGDLVFWTGHVGLMQTPETLLHATAFSMSVITEPLATTAARVKQQGNGHITAIRRL